MPAQSLPQFPCLKGVVASNQPLAEPKGAVVRASNLLLETRGALDPCDGTQILFAYNGAVQNNRLKFLATFLFQPAGVSPYYLAIGKETYFRLNTPQHLTTSSGGAHTFVVTALDGAGGETIKSNSVSSAVPATLTWNVVPNAIAYNVYQDGFLLFGPGLPVAQPAAGALTVSYSVTGSETNIITSAITSLNFSSYYYDPNVFATTYYYILNLSSAITILSAPVTAAIAGTSNANLNASNYVLYSQPSSTQALVSIEINGNPNSIYMASATGGTLTIQPGPPVAVNTTQQTALYRMPTIGGSPAVLPISYNESNIVAFYPADPFTTMPFSPQPRVVPVGFGAGPGSGRGGSGGSGSGGGTGGGGTTGGATPSGGIQGNVSFIPQFAQFTDRAIIALGNGYPPQAYSDPTTSVNPATTANISSISADAYGVVTVTTSTANGAIAGGNILISGVSPAALNGAFVVTHVVSSTQFNVTNVLAASDVGTGGTTTTTSLPLQSSFVPSYPPWTANTIMNVGDIIVPATQPSPPIYVTVTQAGTTGPTEPTPWPTTTGALVIDSAPSPVGPARVQYTVTGQLVGGVGSPAPPPPGAGHIQVYAGALWVWNTWPSNTSNGLDGPSALRMSNINNPNSWNPVNQAFLDKDDGQEGMGLAKFTITALGIPPEGSLIAFKDYESYQVLGVFGASNFGIQPISTDMGCISPRTIGFIPGYGIMRYTHLGAAVFNGVKDEVMSEQIRPYLFPSDDQVFSDITVVDSNWLSVAWGAGTANPPMYVMAMPIGNSNGQLTRLFCFDLVLKAWIIVDLPWGIGTASDFKGQATNPVTVFGGFNDGCISRWQAGDALWDVGATGARSPSQVQWALQSLTVASGDTDQRVYVRRLVFTAINAGLSGNVTVSYRRDRVVLGTRTFQVQGFTNFDIDIAVGFTGKQFDAIIYGNCNPDINGITWEVEPRPMGVVVAI